MVTTVAPVHESNSQPGREWSVFKIQRNILLIFGCWPPDRSTRRWYVQAFIALNLVTLAICIVGELSYCIDAYLNGSLIETIESIGPTVARFAGFSRMCLILKNERQIESVVNKMVTIINDAHRREKFTKRERITKRITVWDQTLSKTVFFSSFTTAALYGLIPYVIMTRNWFRGQYPLVKLLPFKMMLPFDSQDTTLFVMTTVFLNYASAPTIAAFTGSDLLFSGLCLYLYGQFRAIRIEMEALSATLNNSTLERSAHETNRINQELRNINKRYQEIINLVSEVRIAFTPSILLVYISSAFMICIVCMAVLITEGINKLTYLPYTLTILMILFVYSFGGMMVRESSEDLQTVAYNFPWYRFDHNTRHLIQMMMVRAKHGCNVDVPFFETSMATFSVIVRSAMSYITLMKSFL
uniref:Uncharacterized protein n=1 Tax=Anopheles epiroticus TaxID=199890 RepID=A0A182P3T1_9DIPT